MTLYLAAFGECISPGIGCIEHIDVDTLIQKIEDFSKSYQKMQPYAEPQNE